MNYVYWALAYSLVVHIVSWIVIRNLQQDKLLWDRYLEEWQKESNEECEQWLGDQTKVPWEKEL